MTFRDLADDVQAETETTIPALGSAALEGVKRADPEPPLR